MSRAHLCVVLVADVALNYAATPRVGRRRHPTRRQQAEVVLYYLQLPRSSDQRGSRLQVCREQLVFMSASCRVLLQSTASIRQYLSLHAGHRSSDESAMSQLQILLCVSQCVPHTAYPTLFQNTAKVARTAMGLSDTAPAIGSSRNLGALLQMISTW